MAGTNTNISIRMDAELKAQADALFAELGMDLSTAFNIFVRQSLREGRIPFEIALNQPSRDSLQPHPGNAAKAVPVRKKTHKARAAQKTLQRLRFMARPRFRDRKSVV